uniref:Uncharacterized protein n=1 Tax=Knipowitschia caucasica TaxID=637954 RepID=A0AAV2MMV8_KNICA
MVYKHPLNSSSSSVGFCADRDQCCSLQSESHGAAAVNTKTCSSRQTLGRQRVKLTGSAAMMDEAVTVSHRGPETGERVGEARMGWSREQSDVKRQEQRWRRGGH